MAEKRKIEVLIPHKILTRWSVLSDAQFGVLLRLLIRYDETGAVPDASHPLYYPFCAEKHEIDEKKRAYEEECERQRQRAQKRWQVGAQVDDQAPPSDIPPADTKECQDMPHHATAYSGMENNAEHADIDIDSDVDVVSDEEREDGHAPPSLSHGKFLNAFPKIELNCDFKPFHDVDLLIQKVKESKWLRTEGANKGLAWLIGKYNRIILNEYKDNLPSQPTAPQPEKAFMRHNYAAGELNNLITGLDNVSYS